MELHSYAKRRTLKKWTIEQKRKLVEARIKHDAWFTNKPSSMVPWKNILISANLSDFNVFFVRKQWSNMLARYKLYKQTRFGSNITSKAIDAELIKRINQEWEFFEPIHKFMTRKTTNLHSYALTHRTDINNGEQRQEMGEEPVPSSTVNEQECRRQTEKSPTKMLHNETITIKLPKDCVKENIPNNSTIVIQSNNNANNIAQDDGINLFSSDTNEDDQVIAETTRIIKAAKQHQSSEDENKNLVRNTDHDFYSKKSFAQTVKQLNCPEADQLQEEQSNYFADASEESQGSLNMVVDDGVLQTTKTTGNLQSFTVTTPNDVSNQSVEFKMEKRSYAIKEEMHDDDDEFLNDMPSTSTKAQLTQNIPTSSKPRLSERDKYYRHKKRFNRRFEKRFDALLEVVGQIIKDEYPLVDITPIVNQVHSLSSAMGKVITSDSEDDD